MRFMVQVRATRDSEAGMMPSADLVAAMGKFNEAMIKAGVMLAGEGLHPSSKGARVVFAGGAPKVIEPPFAEPEQLVSGFWIIQVDSLETAIGWMKRAPFGDGQVLEIRRVFRPATSRPISCRRTRRRRSRPGAMRNRRGRRRVDAGARQT
jgi:hypothetical protein